MDVIRSERYAGLDCVRISNNALDLWVTRMVGPRIIGLSFQGGENLLAVVPEEIYTHADGRVFSFRGGHRLWTAPELPKITYLPDDLPVDIEEVHGGVRVVQPLDPISGLQKTLKVHFPGGGNRVILDHTIRNEGSETVTLAAWAITQLRPGGIGILPQETGTTDPHGLQPNRQLAFWPYADVRSPHFITGNRYLMVRSEFETGAFKVGFSNSSGWLAYLNGGSLFVKLAEYFPGQTYPDFGSSSQCFCNKSFLELETLSPLVYLFPGESISHRETWVIYDQVDLQIDPIDFEYQFDRLVDSLGGVGGG